MFKRHVVDADGEAREIEMTAEEEVATRGEWAAQRAAHSVRVRETEVDRLKALLVSKGILTQGEVDFKE